MINSKKYQLLYLHKLLMLGMRSKPILLFSFLLTPLNVVVELFAAYLIYPILSGKIEGVASQIMNLLFPFLNGEQNNSNFLIKILLWTLILRVVLNIANQSIFFQSGRELHGLVSCRLFGVIIQKLDYKIIQHRGVGEFVSMAGDESFRFSNIIVSLFQLLNSILLGVGYLITIIYISTSLFSFIFLFGSVVLAITFGSIKKLKHIGEKQIVASREASGVFIDSLNNIKSLRSFGGESFCIEKYRQSVTSYVKLLGESELLQVYIRNIPLILLLVITLIFMQLSKGDSRLDIPFLVTAIACFSRIVPIAGTVIGSITKIANDLKLSKDITHLYYYEPPSSVQTDSLEDAELGQILNINIRNLFFKYDKSSPEIFKGLSLRFNSGKTYCIVGDSGKGKSTLLDILMMFRDDFEGEIIFNDSISNKKISTNVLRKKILYIEQRTAIFNDSFKNNLTFGDSFSDGKILNALDSLGLKRLLDIGESLNTNIAYQGTNLSGGQKQRLQICRALIRCPDVIIFDEALVGLDLQTKEDVFNKILNEFKMKIVIFVSHDPWVTSKCDEIIDLNHI